MEPFEDELRQSGVEHIAGLDEAGRGSLFGPVVAAAAVIGIRRLPPVDDSKRMTARQRQCCFNELVDALDDWAIGLASAQEIDRINILQATRLAMARAIGGLRHRPHHLLVDGNFGLSVEIPQTALVHGDARCRSIAAASIIAKVARDTLLAAYAQTVRGYGLARNMGYGTLEHRTAIRRRGLSALHRRSFGRQAKLPFDRHGV